MDEAPFLEVVPMRVVVRDYMEDITLVVPNPEVYAPPRGTPTVSDISYRHIYVSVAP